MGIGDDARKATLKARLERFNAQLVTQQEWRARLLIGMSDQQARIDKAEARIKSLQSDIYVAVLELQELQKRTAPYPSSDKPAEATPE